MVAYFSSGLSVEVTARCTGVGTACWGGLASGSWNSSWPPEASSCISTCLVLWISRTSHVMEVWWACVYQIWEPDSEWESVLAASAYLCADLIHNGLCCPLSMTSVPACGFLRAAKVRYREHWWWGPWIVETLTNGAAMPQVGSTRVYSCWSHYVVSFK